MQTYCSRFICNCTHILSFAALLVICLASNNVDARISASANENENVDAHPATCAEFNELTTDCDGMCPNNAACAKYRDDGDCKSADASTCLHNVTTGCTYECYDMASGAIDEWYFEFYGVPAWDTSLAQNWDIEAVREIHVPRNITKVFSFSYATSRCSSFRGAMDGYSEAKGYVAQVEFPDGRVVNSDSLLTTLGLVNIDIAKVPDTVYDFPLDTLALQNCLIETIPAPLLNATQLTYLRITQNNLSRLPPEIANLPLTALFLDDNNFLRFPLVLGNMTKLKTLSLIGNSIHNVDLTASAESSLEELSLDSNLLPDFAGIFPSLQRLFLTNNLLTAFPSTVNNLTSLIVLDLAANRIDSESIDRDLDATYHKGLDELVLSSNLLTRVPDLSDSFPLLSTLKLRNNSITTVEGVFRGKVVNLFMRTNGMTTFNASFPRVQVLDIGDNAITSIPELQSISPSLMSLNISMNNFKTLNSDDSDAILTELNASMNSMTQFNMNLSMIASLDLSDNAFDSIPDCVFQYRTLTEFYFTNNTSVKIQNLTDYQYDFLNRLAVLKVDADMFDVSNCPTGSKQLLQQTILVCVIASTALSQSSVTNTETDDSNSGSFLESYLIVIAGVLVVQAVAGFIITYRQRRNRLRNGSHARSSSTQKLSSRGTAYSYDIWSDEELRRWRVDLDSIKMETMIATGAFGQVWLARYRSEQVAVKKLSDRAARDKQSVENFIDELKLLSRLDHQRIVHFYGVAWTTQSDLCAVLEYLSNGDLHELLRTETLPRQNWNQTKFQIAIDVIEALTYVHSLDPILVHRDLKSRNVLLDDDLRAKITDFGTSRYQSDAETMTCGVGTGRWMAPEVIAGKTDYNESVDVYSFGVILSELDTHKLPYHSVLTATSMDRTENELENGHEQQQDMKTIESEYTILQLVAVGELKPTFSSTCPPAIYEIAQKCLAFHPADRPSCLEVAYWLRKAITASTILSRTANDTQNSTRSQQSDIRSDGSDLVVKALPTDGFFV